MKLINPVKLDHLINTGISPNEGDVAIVSIDVAGTRGELNSMVLEHYGYNIKDLPYRKQLEFDGFAPLIQPNKKPILFVVTVDARETSETLAKNLYRTLEEFRGWFLKKKLWIPLMGTGAGGLNFEESYNITINAINSFHEKYPIPVTILISIPDNEEGRTLIKKINASKKNDYKDTEKFIKSLGTDFYLVGTIWEREEQLPRFTKEKIWETGYIEGNYSDVINGVNENDILIAKSSYATSGGDTNLKIKAIGIVSKNHVNGISLEVDWVIKDLNLHAVGLGYYRNTITRVYLNEVTEIFSLIDQSLLQQLLTRSSTPILNSSKIAGLLSDSEKGEDHLDITKDVNAFARVIANKSFDPPIGNCPIW